MSNIVEAAHSRYMYLRVCPSTTIDVKFNVYDYQPKRCSTAFYSPLDYVCPLQIILTY